MAYTQLIFLRKTIEDRLATVITAQKAEKPGHAAVAAAVEGAVSAMIPTVQIGERSHADLQGNEVYPRYNAGGDAEVKHGLILSGR